MVIKRKISKEEVNTLPKATFTGHIVVVQSEEEANKAVKYLSAQPAIGIDSETRPSFAKGEFHKVALLQLSSQEYCFLFRLNYIGFPESLIGLLENSSVKKIGLSLQDDFMMLRKRKPFQPQSCIELQQFVEMFGIEDKSLQKIYANLFGEKISKAQRLSNWETDILSDAQKAYAAIDAWACLNIYNKLIELEQSGEYTVQSEIV